MNRAREVEFKERTNKVYRNRKDDDDATQIKEVNELDYDCYEEINQMQNFQPRFNSTIKPQNNSHGAQSSGYQSGNSPRNNSYQQNCYPSNTSTSNNQTGYNRPNYSQNTSN